MKKLFTILFSMLIFTAVFASDAGMDKKDPFLKEFAVYPNPSTGVVNISFESFDGNKPMQLKVMNLLGQEMHTQFIQPFSGKQELRLDLGNYAKGLYFLEISDGKNSKTKRISII